MQTDATDVARINHSGSPEGVISANPSSFCHDTTTGIIYYKFSGTGNTGWFPVFQPLSQKLYNSTSDFIGYGNWNSSGNTLISSIAGHVGILETSAADPINFLYLDADFGNMVWPVLLGSGVFTANFIIKLNTLSSAPNQYQAYFGLTDTILISDPQDPTNGIWFYYTDTANSGKWVVKTSSGGVITSVNTTVDATTGWVNLGFTVNAAANAVNFTIDGVAVGSTISTNIPSVAMCAFMAWLKTGDDPGSWIDLVTLNYLLTTSR